MKGAWFGKWVISSRFEAHIAWPGLVSLVLIALYFFGNRLLQSWVAPGALEIPSSAGGHISIPEILEAFMLAWIVLLAAATVPGSRDKLTRLLAALLGLGGLAALLALVSRKLSGHEALMALPGGIGGWIDLPMLGQMPPVALVAGTFAAVFFAVVPLLYGDRRHPVYAMLIPSRWMLLTFALMIGAPWVANTLHDKGWGLVNGEHGALGEDFSVFMMLVFEYMVLLFIAELRYLSAVRKAGPLIVRHL